MCKISQGKISYVCCHFLMFLLTFQVIFFLFFSQMAKSKANTSTHNELDIFRTNSKELLVIRDPLFVHPSIKDGHYVGREPHSYFPLAVFVTVINPALGPIALIFACELVFNFYQYFICVYIYIYRRLTARNDYVRT